jgi:hypothetical protein
MLRKYLIERNTLNEKRLQGQEQNLKNLKRSLLPVFNQSKLKSKNGAEVPKNAHPF